MKAIPLLAALQLGDSAFPSGAFTQSYGLETLVAERAVSSAAGVEDVLSAHLRHRMARADLPALLAAHRAAAEDNVELVLRIDAALTAIKMTREERQASHRMGARLMTEARRLASNPILPILPILESSPQNAAVAFALAGLAMGLSARESAFTYAYSFASSLVSASMRLLRIGHGEAQAVLLRSHPAIEQAVAKAETVPWDALCPCAPRLELAAARHERSAARLFAS
jgi:urease accessory protein